MTQEELHSKGLCASGGGLLLFQRGRPQAHPGQQALWGERIHLLWPHAGSPSGTVFPQCQQGGNVPHSVDMCACQFLDMLYFTVQWNLVAWLDALPSSMTPDMMRRQEDCHRHASQSARWHRRARQRRHQGLQHPSQRPAPPLQCTPEAASLWARPRAPGLRQGARLRRRRLAASRSAALTIASPTGIISHSTLRQR